MPWISHPRHRGPGVFIHRLLLVTNWVGQNRGSFPGEFKQSRLPERNRVTLSSLALYAARWCHHGLWREGKKPDGWTRMALPKLVTLGKPPRLHGHSPDARAGRGVWKGRLCGRKQMAPTTFSEEPLHHPLLWFCRCNYTSSQGWGNLPQISKLFQRIKHLHIYM